MLDLRDAAARRWAICPSTRSPPTSSSSLSPSATPGQHHRDLEQVLSGVRLGLRRRGGGGSGHRPPPSLLEHGQHPGRELPAQGQAAGRRLHGADRQAARLSGSTGEFETGLDSPLRPDGPPEGARGSRQPSEAAVAATTPTFPTNWPERCYRLEGCFRLGPVCNRPDAALAGPRSVIGPD